MVTWRGGLAASRQGAARCPGGPDRGRLVRLLPYEEVMCDVC